MGRPRYPEDLLSIVVCYGMPRILTVAFHARRLPRAVLTRGYALLARAALRPPVSDTEAGCKFFRREAPARYAPRPGRRSTVRVAPAVAEYLKGLWSLRAIGER